MIRDYLKKNIFFKVIMYVLIASVLGVIALTLVEILPVNVAKKHAYQSIDSFRSLGTNPRQTYEYEGTTVDTYTDAWMFRIATYNGNESAIERAMSGYYYGYTDGKSESVVDSTIRYLNEEEGSERFSYSRYWHGYLLYLKPMLMFLRYDDIIEIVRALGLGLIVAVAIFMYIRGLYKYIPIYIATMGFINFSTTISCLQYADVLFISLIGSLILLIKANKWGRSGLMVNEYMILFAAIGISTAFFDFLTYPLFSLGFCMVIWILLQIQNDSTINIASSRWYMMPCNVIKGSIAWGIGYFGMWCMKWIWGTLLTNENALKLAINSINERTSSDVEGESFVLSQVFTSNLSIVRERLYYVLVLLIVSYGVTLILMSKIRINKSEKNEINDVSIQRTSAICSLLICCILPFVWFVATKNHSYLHGFMVYRILGITFFAGGSGIVYLSEKCNINKVLN